MNAQLIGERATNNKQPIAEGGLANHRCNQMKISHHRHGLPPAIVADSPRRCWWIQQMVMDWSPTKTPQKGSGSIPLHALQVVIVECDEVNAARNQASWIVSRVEWGSDPQGQHGKKAESEWCVASYKNCRYKTVHWQAKVVDWRPAK